MHFKGKQVFPVPGDFVGREKDGSVRIPVDQIIADCKIRIRSQGSQEKLFQVIL